MKRKMSLILAAALAASLAMTGCGGSGQSTGDTSAAGGDGTESVPAQTAGESKGAQVDTTGYLVAVLNADIQTADVQKTSKDYQTPMNIFDRLVDIKVGEDGATSI